MIKIGITGGMGSGKSVVSTLLSIMGVPVYIADKESKRLTLTSETIKEKLISRFGKELYAGGALNKSLLASIIFADKDSLEYVNGVIHPVVREDFQAWAERQTGRFAAIESAILFESGFDSSVDVIVSVAAPQEIRMERIQLRDRLSTEQIRQRLANQWPEEEKYRRSHFIIHNDGQQAVIPQLETLLQTLSDKFLP